MIRLLTRWSERFDRFLASETLAERERYLAQSQNALDLERRLRELEQHLPEQGGLL